jgi:DNA recombination protein RmuC
VILLLALLVVAMLGAILFLLSRVARGGAGPDPAREAQRDAERRAELERVVDRLKAEIGTSALDALGKARETLVAHGAEQLGARLAAGSQDLQTKKALIDQSLERVGKQMADELARLNATVRELEKDREGKFGDLAARLAEANEATRALASTTGSLREALGSTKARGAWGERMAEDILRSAGFREGVNYQKQQTLEGSGRRPDYVFFLPNGQRLHMDVKFPLTNYLRSLEADTDDERRRYRDEFVRDARTQLKEITSRDYIDPAVDTIDRVLLFIPNEQVYGFLQEADRTLVDDAIAARVVLCSPFTLYAVLALLRQIIDNFNIEKTSRDILVLLSDIETQWAKFVKQMETMGQRIEQARVEYDKLTTTRRRALDRRFEKIDALREARIAEGGEPTALPLELDENEEPGRAPDANAIADDRLIPHDD